MNNEDRDWFVGRLHALRARELGMDDRARAELASQFAIDDPDGAGWVIAVLLALLPEMD